MEFDQVKRREFIMRLGGSAALRRCGVVAGRGPGAGLSCSLLETAAERPDNRD